MVRQEHKGKSEYRLEIRGKPRCLASLAQWDSGDNTQRTIDVYSNGGFHKRSVIPLFPRQKNIGTVRYAVSLKELSCYLFMVSQLLIHSFSLLYESGSEVFKYFFSTSKQNAKC